MAELIFEFGTMNISKSARIIMQAYQHMKNGKKVFIFKPSRDTRDGAYVISRALQTVMPAILIDELYKMYNTVSHEKPHIVFVDEVHFFSREFIEELALIVDDLDITVHAYGLLTDFRSEMFEGSKRLMELADKRIQIESECTECERTAVVNARLVNGEVQVNGEQIVPGAEDIYKVLCRKCFFDKLGSI